MAKITVEEILDDYYKEHGITKTPLEAVRKRKTSYIRCENNAGSTWSVDCGVCPACLSKVPAVDLAKALFRRLLLWKK